MRGCAPLLVALASGPLTGEALGAAQWLATLLICGGVLLLWLPRAQPGPRPHRFALATACVIAAYTVVDGAGVRRSGAPAAYTLWIFLLTGIGVCLGAARGRWRALLVHARENPLVAPAGRPGLECLVRHRAVGHDAGAGSGRGRAARDLDPVRHRDRGPGAARAGRTQAAAAAGLIACGAIAMRLG
jgi:hypothetical protein